MTNTICHSVTNSVSHTCPDQTRPDQTVLKSSGGVFGCLPRPINSLYTPAAIGFRSYAK